MSTPTSKTILCIDDDSINLLVLKHLVHSMGYTTESATSGEEGLAILKEKAIDTYWPRNYGTKRECNHKH